MAIQRSRLLAVAVTLGLAAAGAVGAAPGRPVELDFPAARSAPREGALEARVEAIVGSMTLAQKIGQMTQPEIRSVTPDEVRRYYIGSVLNGGGSWPAGRRDASAGDWLALSMAYHQASMSTDMKVPVPIIWGTDAVHGHNNVRGATLFPHNIGLGAANDPALVRDIGAATARAVRATGIQWVFAPTLAVARDDRWGRTYESFSELPARVAALGEASVRGLQGRLDEGVSVAASNLQAAGIIEYSRGTITIVDREKLETSACECYQVVVDEYTRLLGEYVPLNDAVRFTHPRGERSE